MVRTWARLLGDTTEALTKPAKSINVAIEHDE